MKCFIIETREVNRSKTEWKVTATTTVIADNSFQALRVMDDHYSKNQCMHEIIDATGANSIVTVGDHFVGIDCCNEPINGKVTKILQNTVIVECGIKYHVVKRSEIENQR